MVKYENLGVEGMISFYQGGEIGKLLVDLVPCLNPPVRYRRLAWRTSLLSSTFFFHVEILQRRLTTYSLRAAIY